MNPPDPNVEVVAAKPLASPKVFPSPVVSIPPPPRADPNPVPAIPLLPAMPPIIEPEADPNPVLRGHRVESCVGLGTRPGLTGPMSGENGVGPVETALENLP